MSINTSTSYLHGCWPCVTPSTPHPLWSTERGVQARAPESCTPGMPGVLRAVRRANPWNSHKQKAPHSAQHITRGALKMNKSQSVWDQSTAGCRETRWIKASAFVSNPGSCYSWIIRPVTYHVRSFLLYGMGLWENHVNYVKVFHTP